jgi:hypothetical protein
VRDAEPASWAPGRRRVARRALIWVHVAGAWRSGHLNAWFQEHDGRWLAWTSYESPGGWAYPASGLFVYDPETIRLRADGHSDPPPEQP